jgi:hypothetical protein
VGGDSVEGEAGGGDGERASVRDGVAVGGVPLEDDVDVLEETAGVP